MIADPVFQESQSSIEVLIGEYNFFRAIARLLTLTLTLTSNPRVFVQCLPVGSQRQNLVLWHLLVSQKFPVLSRIAQKILKRRCHY